jgi:hypothetical protein
MVDTERINNAILQQINGEICFDADYVDLEVDLNKHTGTIRHEIGGHLRKHYFTIERIDKSSDSEDGYFIEGETDQSEQEIVIDTGLGEYSVGGTTFNVDNNTFLTAKFEDPRVELGVSPDQYDCVLVDKRGFHCNSVRFNVSEVRWDFQGEHEQTHIEGVTEDDDEITVEPEDGFYEITEVCDRNPFGPGVVMTGSSFGKSWESTTDFSATEPEEPIGTISYEGSDDDTVEVNTMTGEMRIDSANVEPISCEVTVGPVDEEENTVTTFDDPEFRDAEDDQSDRVFIGGDETFDGIEPEMVDSGSVESAENEENSDESDSSSDRDESVSFLDDVTYEPY